VSIKVSKRALISEQCLLQRYINVHIQIVLDTLKYIVLLLFQNQYNVALQHVGHLLTLSLVDNFFLMHHSLLDIDCECFRFLNDFLSSAVSAVLLVNSAFTFTFIARLLHLHLHEAHILHDFDHTLSFAFIASFGLSPLSSATLAFLTVYVSLNSDFFYDSGV